MRTRMTLAAALVTAALALAGCGGGSGAGSGSTLGGAAAVAPSDAAAFVALDSDLGSSQWQTVDGLLQKLPGQSSLVTLLQQALAKHTKLSWANDVQPALGPELDVVVLPGAAKPQAVALLQPADQAKLDALLQQIGAAGSTKPVSEQIGGWTAVSDSQAALDAVKSASTHLADNTVYQDATGRLSGDAVVQAYGNGAEARQVLSALGKSLPAPSAGRGQLVWASADAVAVSGGLRVDGYLRTQGAATQPQAYAPGLVHRIPAGTLAVADFQAKGATGTSAAPALPATSPLAGLLAPLQKLGASLGGETAVYVGGGVPLPSVTLVTHSSDPQATLDALNQAIAGIGSAATKGSSGSGGLNLGSILGAIALQHEVVDGNLVVSTSAQAIADFKGSGQKLADDGAFKEAESASAMPGQTTGFVYVNLKDALPLVQGLAALAGGSSSSGSLQDLGALRTLTAYGTASGDVQAFTLFLGVG